MSSEDQEDDYILVAPIALRTVMSGAQGLPQVVEVVAARGQELALDYRLGVDTAMNWWAHRKYFA